MEQKQFFPKAEKRRRRRERWKRFFSETFRAHSKEEYKEFFTRGFDGQIKENKVYPWMYIRMLVFGFLLFAATTFFMYLTRNGISFPAMMFLGAVMFNIPFITLIYELCPQTDMSFLKLMFVLVVGGSVAIILMQLGYMAFSPEEGYGQVAWIAFLEELAKLIPAIVAILIMRKQKNPLAAFAVAAAVGAGVSIIEDMGYIFSQGYVMGIDVAMSITVSVVRGVSSVATHTVWVGYIGWIFAKCKKPYIDIRFYGVCVLSMALHFLWDLTIANGALWSLLGILAGFIFCLCFTRWLGKKERGTVKKAYAEEEAAKTAESAAVCSVEVGGEQLVIEGLEAEGSATAEGLAETAAADGDRNKPVVYGADGFPEEDIATKKKKRARYSQAANIIAAIASVMVGILALNGCMGSIGYAYEQKVYSGTEEQKLISFLQNGRELYYDWNRKFDESVKVEDCYSYTYHDGKPISATQIVDGIYYYDYFWYEPSENEQDKAENGGNADGDTEGNTEERPKYKEGWNLTSILVKIDDRFYDCLPLYYVVDEDGEVVEEIYYFLINDKVIECTYEELTDMYVVTLNNVVFNGLATLIGLCASGAFVMFVGVLLFVLFKVNSKKLGKQIAAAENENGGVAENVSEDAAGGGAEEEVAVADGVAVDTETAVETADDNETADGETRADGSEDIKSEGDDGDAE